MEHAEFITPKDLSLVTGKCLRTLQDWRKAGKGPKWSLVDGKVMYRKEDVRAWLDRPLARLDRLAEARLHAIMDQLREALNGSR